jgi:sugar lactone lactonase YvrE
VAGGNGRGNRLNQLCNPCGVYVDDDQTIYVADTANNRIVEWKNGATSGQVVAGERNDQLNCPTNVIVDQENDSLIICDFNNKRVVRWPRRNGTSEETIISNVSCWDLKMDNDGYLYVSDHEKHEVRRWKIGETNGKLIAGGNGIGNRLDQLNGPRYIFVDQDHSVYVSDAGNNRVMKWMKDAKEGIVVAGGQTAGTGLTHLAGPHGVIVDQLGTVYVADLGNGRVMCWLKEATQGSIIVRRNGGKSNQLNLPFGLSFDRQNNLYVTDCSNHRVHKFNIKSNSN